MSTAILSETYRISSELRSQATAGLVSTTVGDHVGIRGAVGSSFSFALLLNHPLAVFLFPSWERPVVGNLSEIVRPDWELGPNRSATPTGSLGVMGVWEPQKLAWESGPK